MYYEAQANFIFYCIAGIAIFSLFLGLAGMVYIWRLGKRKPLNAEIKDLKWVTSFLNASLLQTQILEYSVLAWLAHILIFWGFIALFLLTTLHFVLSWLVPHSSVFFHYFTGGNGNLLMAVWGDFWGVVLLSGILIALFRRYIIRPETLNTISSDAIAIWFLFVLTISGFVCEIVRLSIYPDSPDAMYSFAVSWIVPFVKHYHWTETVMSYLFWIHGILSLLFIAYIPFSKFRHMFSSPMVFSFVTADEQYSRGGWIKNKPLPLMLEDAGHE